MSNEWVNRGRGLGITVALATGSLLALQAGACGDGDTDGSNSTSTGSSSGGGNPSSSSSGHPGGAGGSGGSVDSVGGGGRANQGGAGGGFECPKGLADCDGDLTNGCEVDLTSDAANCGACGTKCDGRCQAAHCSPFEVIATKQYSMSSTIAFTADSVFWSSSSDGMNQSADSYSLWKAASDPLGLPTSLVTNLPPGYIVAAGSQKLYAVSFDYHLQSVGFDGTGYGQEVPYAASVAFASPNLWYVQNYNGAVNLNWKNVVTAATGTAFTKSYDPNVEQYGISTSFVIGDDGRAYYALNHDNADYTGPAYALQAVGTSGVSASVVPRRSGSLGRIRQQNGDLFWVENSAGDAQASVLLSLKSGASYANPVQGTTNVKDFVVDEPKIYYTFYDGQNRISGLRSYDLTTETVTDLVIGPYLGTIELSGSYLYIADTSGARLLRLPLTAVQ